MDNSNSTSQGSRNFNAYKILGVIQAAITLTILNIDPLPVDQSHQYITGLHFVFKYFGKIQPCWDFVYIHENCFFAKMISETVVDTPGITGAVVSTITDENPS